MAFLSALLARLGIDKAIANVLLARGWSVISGPISILCVAHFLSSVEQGYFYTFASLQGLQIFFELGLTFVIMQFASHEKAGLEWAPDGTLQGDFRSKMRLGSLLRFSIRWYAFAAVAAALALSFAGLWFFKVNHAGTGQKVVWEIPWILVVCTTASSLFLSPIYGIIEGCGRISEVNGIFARQAILASFIFWVCLWAGAKLYAVPIMGLIPLLIAAPWIFSKYLKMFRDLWNASRGSSEKIYWRTEIWPMQWKISLSWASGYFIFQLANPILFRYHGPVVAGQYGMSMKLVDSIQSLAYAWVSTKSATFGTLIAQSKMNDLIALFKTGMKGSVYAVVGFSFLFISLIVTLRYFDFSIAQRLLPPRILILMCANGLTNCVIFSIAALLRSEKREPFLAIGIIGAMLNTVCIFTVGVSYGATGIVVSFLVLNCMIGLPFSLYLLYEFMKRKKVI